MQSIFGTPVEPLTHPESCGWPRSSAYLFEVLNSLRTERHYLTPTKSRELHSSLRSIWPLIGRIRRMGSHYGHE